jgi:peptidyl-prolyl cis-trans isomerase SurA
MIRSWKNLPLTAVVVAMCATACTSTATPAAAPAPVSPDTWAVVNGKAITRQDVDAAFKRTQDGSQPISDEEALTAKLNLLNDLILQELLLEKAATQKIEVPQAEIDTAYTDGKKNIPDDAFQQELTKRGLTPADMREGLRRELLTQKVIAAAVTAKVSVTDQAVTEFFNANRAQFNLPEEAYHIAQIAVTPVRDAQITNQSGDDATTPEAATAKVQMLIERLKAGTPFQELAATYSEDPESAPRGGDIGLVPVSRLKQAAPALRDAVLNKAPGSVNVASVGGGHTIVLVVAHEQAGQRDLSTPGVREQITETLRGRREQLLRAAYLTSVRSDATVVNYLARRLVESNGVAPTVQVAAPGQK